ncbi:MAG: quinolinate synthase NadA [Candidatus Eiseniibacteriota bacterium]
MSESSATGPAGAVLDGPRPITDYEELTDAELDRRIGEAKARLGARVTILGHHYQRDEVVRYADFLGDSYRLSQRGSESVADFIVFCGVHFMAESADILAKPDQRVILPDLGAGCSMADMAEIDSVEEAWEELVRAYGDTIVPITYMNSTAAIKAFVGRNGGLVCTSSNARAAFEWAYRKKPRILFLPDEHLGRNTGADLGIALDRMGLWDPRVDPRAALAALPQDPPLVLWRGHCSVHQRFTPEQVAFLRKEIPGIKIIVHPECKHETCRVADFVGSTDFIIRTITAASPGTKWAVGTEIHLVNRLAQQMPDKLVISLQRNVCACATMYRIDPVHLCWALENLVQGHVVNEIRVDDETIRWARVALERMLEVK